MKRKETTAANEHRCLVIVDDATSILTILEWLFKDRGYSVHTFTRAETAFAFITENPVDAVISDWQMPDMDGLELAQKLQQSSWTGFLCLLSGHACFLKNRPLAEMGIHQLVEKPFDAFALADSIRQALEASEC